MTNDQLKGLREAIDAKLAGKDWQYREIGDSEWVTLLASSKIGQTDGFEFRAKPVPATRPWNCKADVPLNCWVRLKESNFDCLVITVDSFGVHVFTGPWRWDKLKSDEAEYSTDRKTWHKCEVAEC